MVKKITEHKVRSLRPKAARYNVNEDNLQLEVNPSGRKVWFVYGWQDGKKFKRKIGEYPSTNVKAAREKVTEILHQRNQGTRIVEDPTSLAAFIEGDFADWCRMNRKRGEETLNRLRHVTIPVLGHKKMREISERDVEAHKANLLKRKAPATVKRDLGDLRRVFSLAVKREKLRESPASGVSDPKVEHAEKLYLSQEETDRLIAALDDWDSIAFSGARYRDFDVPRNPNEPSGYILKRDLGNGKVEFRFKGFSEIVDKPHPKARYYNPEFSRFVFILMYTGLRTNEALQLQHRDFSPGSGTPDDPANITVRPEVSKSGRRRVIPINDDLSDDLRSFLSLSAGTVRSNKHTPMFTLKHPQKAWNKLRKMANLEHITMHQLRHNFASQLVLKGAAPSVIQRLMGHTSIETTMLYFSVRKEDELEAVNLLNFRSSNGKGRAEAK